MNESSFRSFLSTQLTSVYTRFWPKIFIKRRIRQVLTTRIRGIINDLDQNLKHRLSVVSLLNLILLLTTTTGQSTFGQFSDPSIKNEDNDLENIDNNENDNNETQTVEDPEKCVLIYVRVSTDEQEQNGRSIDSQIDELTSIVEHDPEIEQHCEPIRDEGKTGTDFDREGIQKVARLAQQDDVTHLMVDTIDRIGRSVAETLMFIHELREKFDVNIMARSLELDIQKPTDRMRVTNAATMADFGTRNRARSAKRSSVDNFIKDKQWSSWYHSVPFGYELENTEGDDAETKGWIEPVEKLKPVINDIYIEFINTENYAETSRKINKTHEDILSEYDGLEEDTLTWRQIKAIVTRPVYRGEPTVPVTTFEHYDPYPSVDDPELQIVDDEISHRAQEICDKISDKYSTDNELTLDPNEYPDEFNPYIIETVSPLVHLGCPDCSSELIADGHQRKLDGELGSRMYKCPNKSCEFQQRWPQESETDMMKILSDFDNLHSIL